MGSLCTCFWSKSMDVFLWEVYGSVSVGSLWKSLCGKSMDVFV